MNSSFFLEYVMHIKLISNVLMQCQAGNGMRTGKKKKKRNWSSCQAFGNKMGSYSLWIVGKSSYIDICTKPGLAKQVIRTATVHLQWRKICARTLKDLSKQNV